MEKILLTGGTGFIGSNLLNKISDFYKVVVITRKKPVAKKFYKKNIILLNFNNYEQLNQKLKKIKINTVIHCATHYVKKHSYTDILKLVNANILLGNIILENLEIMKVKKFINFSTVWQDPKNTNGKYTNLYSAYKRSFSEIVEFYKQSLKNIKFFEMLISDTFGNNDKRKKLISVLKYNYQNNKPTHIISKNLFINLINVKDLNYLILKVLNNKVLPDRYIVCNPKDIKLIELIKNINKNNKKKIKINWVSKKIIRNKLVDYNSIKNWTPNESKIEDIISYIKE